MNINNQSKIGKSATNTRINETGIVTGSHKTLDADGNSTINYLIAYGEGTKHVQLNMVNEKHVLFL